MAHNILHDKHFYSYREVAWHKLGYVSEEELRIPDILARPDIGIEVPTIQEVPVKTNGDIEIPLPQHKAIVGTVSGEHVPFTVVGQHYSVLTHQQFLDLWDEVTSAPVETLGVLNPGDTVFITTKIKTFDIKGDEIEQYLLATNVLNGYTANSGKVTGVRVVCANTLQIALEHNVKDTFRAIHTKAGMDEFRRWIRNTWEAAQAKSETFKEACEILASAPVRSEDQVGEFLNQLYPIPPHPEVGFNENPTAWAQWDRQQRRVLETHDSIKELFNGVGAGSELPSARNTLWGLYNSVTEFEDHVRRSTDESRTFGASMKRKEHAAELLLAVARS